jgi:ABC-type amino acid transport system permease subunit
MARLTDKQLPPRPPRPPLYSPPGVRPPRPPADPALQQRAWAALMLAVISLFGMMMIGNVRRGVYVVAVALIIAAIALWLSISAMSRARRGGTGRPRGAVFATVLGAVGLVFSAFVLAGFAMFWPQLTQYSNCLSGANTVSAQQACQQQLNNSVGNEVSVLGG